ncbi:uncharacterized protein EI97DRAFT_77284 [Westerdykella ornata]|uniref:Uncharacterized protein n=1 Tax=Westerdykella ornata TaxID=318751 RepID=A0A6A6JFV6_WESOR|nr:uncharacterized protein EI97DRAFT_77284 [Westerdykella ornata]KAF2275510.1 hypothetical protein EI97DRAFT_77284 [Westerdykella ornata]
MQAFRGNHNPARSMLCYGEHSGTQRLFHPGTKAQGGAKRHARYPDGRVDAAGSILGREYMGPFLQAQRARLALRASVNDGGAVRTPKKVDVPADLPSTAWQRCYRLSFMGAPHWFRYSRDIAPISALNMHRTARPEMPIRVLAMRILTSDIPMATSNETWLQRGV